MTVIQKITAAIAQLTPQTHHIHHQEGYLLKKKLRTENRNKSVLNYSP